MQGQNDLQDHRHLWVKMTNKISVNYGSLCKVKMTNKITFTSWLKSPTRLASPLSHMQGQKDQQDHRHL